MIRVLMSCAALAAMTGCMNDDPAEAEATERQRADEIADELPAIEQVSEAYSGWYLMSNWQYPGKTVSVRFCKTSDRIYWQFTGNTAFTSVESSGTTFGPLTSNIAGVYSGSKYRTRNGATGFYLRFWGPGGVPNLWKDFSVGAMPGC